MNTRTNESRNGVEARSPPELKISVPLSEGMNLDRLRRYAAKLAVFSTVATILVLCGGGPTTSRQRRTSPNWGRSQSSG
ncbi:hypothetical protein [Haladaptatus halobius]|uniref:hypothetical protein n=1 Tax=Haladaptatus halobius TaxID=2884875 RepID=UPI001D0A203C|nr:hypothetical protein [Haladaptatus halobius]